MAPTIAPTTPPPPAKGGAEARTSTCPYKPGTKGSPYVLFLRRRWKYLGSHFDNIGNGANDRRYRPPNRRVARFVAKKLSHYLDRFLVEAFSLRKPEQSLELMRILFRD
jgi:hypothetical protein